MKIEKNIVYYQSGGPTAVINTTCLGVIEEAYKHSEISHVYGSLYGIEGIIDDNLIDLSNQDKEQLSLLKQTPGAVLKTSRKKLPDDFNDEIYKKIEKTILKHHISIILPNGGNDSMDTCLKLAKYFKYRNMNVSVIGIPKTIDNDLTFNDHSIGYPSACRTIMNLIKMIIVDSSVYSKGKVTIIETMGRDAGWLTASSFLCDEKPDLIYLPEMTFDLKDFLNKVNEIYRKKGYAFIVISEGIKICGEKKKVQDSFGHVIEEGVANKISQYIEEKLNLLTRSIVLSIPQRADPYFITKTDSKEAYNVGKYAVRFALKGKTAQMVCIKRINNNPYKIKYFLHSLEGISNEVNKFPQKYIESSGYISISFKQYLSPLIDDGIKIKISKNGLFKIAKLDYSLVK